jgi:hypothetical protein
MPQQTLPSVVRLQQRPESLLFFPSGRHFLGLSDFGAALAGSPPQLGEQAAQGDAGHAPEDSPARVRTGEGAGQIIEAARIHRGTPLDRLLGLECCRPSCLRPTLTPRYHSVNLPAATHATLPVANQSIHQGGVG